MKYKDLYPNMKFLDPEVKDSGGWICSNRRYDVLEKDQHIYMGPCFGCMERTHYFDLLMEGMWVCSQECMIALCKKVADDLDKLNHNKSMESQDDD